MQHSFRMNRIYGEYTRTKGIVILQSCIERALIYTNEAAYCVKFVEICRTWVNSRKCFFGWNWSMTDYLRMWPQKVKLGPFSSGIKGKYWREMDKQKAQILKILVNLFDSLLFYNYWSKTVHTFASELWRNNVRGLRFWCIKCTNP